MSVSAKTVLIVLTVALTGTANAAGWRSLRIDASSEAAYSESVVTFQKKLSPSRRLGIRTVVAGIWVHRTQRAASEQREYTQADYLSEIDGLGYKDVVTLPRVDGLVWQRC